MTSSPLSLPRTLISFFSFPSRLAIRIPIANRHRHLRRFGNPIPPLLLLRQDALLRPRQARRRDANLGLGLGGVELGAPVSTAIHFEIRVAVAGADIGRAVGAVGVADVALVLGAVAVAAAGRGAFEEGLEEGLKGGEGGGYDGGADLDGRPEWGSQG